MLKSIISYIRKHMKNRTRKYLSQRELEEYMRVEGVSYAELFHSAHPEHRE